MHKSTRMFKTQHMLRNKPDPLPEDIKFVMVKAGLLACVLLMAFPFIKTVALLYQQA